MTESRLIAICVGLPRPYSGRRPDREWTSGVDKRAMDGPVWLGRENLAGDGQADRQHHGGPDRAVLAYSFDHYPAWREELRRELPPGSFAENFAIAARDESTVCIGDTYAIGTALVQVAQPRQPCVKIARRLGIPDLTRRVERTGRTGWYLRVLNEGVVTAGDEVRLRERPHPAWTITRAHAVMRRAQADPAARELSSLGELSVDWRSRLAALGAHLEGASRADPNW